MFAEKTGRFEEVFAALGSDQIGISLSIPRPAWSTERKEEREREFAFRINLKKTSMCFTENEMSACR